MMNFVIAIIIYISIAFAFYKMFGMSAKVSFQNYLKKSMFVGLKVSACLTAFSGIFYLLMYISSR